MVIEFVVYGTQCNLEQPNWLIHLTCTDSEPVRLRVECCKPYQYVNLLGDQVLQITMVMLSHVSAQRLSLDRTLTCRSKSLSKFYYCASNDGTSDNQSAHHH